MKKLLLLAPAIAALLLSSCIFKKGPAAPEAKVQPPAQVAVASKSFGDRQTLDLKEYRGRVLVLELGVVGCEMTGEVYDQLRKVRKEIPPEVAFVKVDCGQSIANKKVAEYYREKAPDGFDVIGDPSGEIGNGLPCQAMPTLFIYCKWGQMRYQGGYEDAEFRKMVAALSAETKPAPENFFFKKVLDKGMPIPEISLPDTEGKTVTAAEAMKGAKAFALVFCGTSCPTSRLGVERMGLLATELADDGLKVLAVNSEKDVQKIRDAYEPYGLTFPVLVDADGAAAKAFNIDTVPTIFITGPDGVVLFRSLWQEEAVIQEVKIALGLMKPEERREIPQQGGG